MTESLENLMSELNKIEEMKQLKLVEIKNKLKSLPIDENLLFFYGESCSFTARVAPEVSCLEIALGKQLTRKEVWNNEENNELYKSVGGPQNCGGVPFFFNQKTGLSVCGARSCDILKAWAEVQR